MDDELKNSGAEFLNMVFKDLADSKEVMHRSNVSMNREERISQYMDALEKTHSRHDKINLLKKMYYEKYVIKEENIPDSLNKRMVISAQKESLDKWIDYLFDEDTKYPIWAKYWVFQGMLKIGTYDEANGVYRKRSKKTIGQFIEANPEIIARCIENVINYVGKKELNDKEVESLIANGNFQKLYTVYLNRNKKIILRNSLSTDGKWIKYSYETEGEAELKEVEGITPEYIKLYNSLQGYNTGWCTAGSIEIAKDQICGLQSYVGGDFYVYYTKDENNEYKVPRIAIRMGRKSIGEIRGRADSQNIEEGFEDIVSLKLSELSLSKEEEQKYLDKIKNMKMLTSINKKNAHNQELMIDEVKFLYSKISGFGWNEDPRIERIIESRMKNGKVLKDYETLKSNVSRDELISKFILGNYGLAFLPCEKDKNIILEIVSQEGRILEYLDELQKNDRDIVLAAVKNYGCSLQYASELLRNDMEIVFTAVKEDGYALQYASESLRSNLEIVTEAIKQNYRAIRFADNDFLLEHKEILFSVIKQNVDAFLFINKKILDNKQVFDELWEIAGEQKKLKRSDGVSRK